MPKSNIRILTKDELEYFNSKYSIKVKDDYVIVECKNYKRTTLHPTNHSFSLLTKKRKMTISKEAIEMWQKYFRGTDWTMIDIQNAMNLAIISYQNLSYSDILQQLKLLKEKYMN